MWGAAKWPCWLMRQCSATLWFCCHCWDCERLLEMGSVSFVVVYHLLSKALQVLLWHLWIKLHCPCVIQYYLHYTGGETWTETDAAEVCWRSHSNSLAVLLYCFPVLSQRQGCPFSLEGAKGRCISPFFQPPLPVFEQSEIVWNSEASWLQTSCQIHFPCLCVRGAAWQESAGAEGTGTLVVSRELVRGAYGTCRGW